jgi:phospholipase/carboxylesterase
VGTLVFRERPAAGEAQGLLILHHGRGSDEHDLLALGEELDPAARLHIVTPRAPLQLPGWPGSHWYVVPRVGYPDARTFSNSYTALARFHDELWRRTGIAPDRTVLGGFSMGAVMSYALALAAERPAPAAIMALSGFIPTVEGWQPSLQDRTGTRVLIAHGRHDAMIEIAFAQRARALLQAGGLSVDYHEFDGGHGVDPGHIAHMRAWLQAR